MKDLVSIVARTVTQSELATRAGCTQGHLSMVLRGLKGCTPDLAGRISEAIGGAVCALHLLYPAGIPVGFGGEAACSCQSQCPQDGLEVAPPTTTAPQALSAAPGDAPGTKAVATADVGPGLQDQREGVTTTTAAAGDRRAA